MYILPTDTFEYLNPVQVINQWKVLIVQHLQFNNYVVFSERFKQKYAVLTSLN